MLRKHPIHWIAHTLLVVGSLLAGAVVQRYATGQTVPPVESVPWPQTPPHLVSSAKPLVMLTAAKDHKLFYEAYDDKSDLDGDGILDIRFKPSITYVGIFNSNYCYGYSGGLFTPVGTAGNDGKCRGQWSGNWLNYVTTSRIDALRVVFYGGWREVDTASDTILRRAYIPQDAHSWAKEYTGPAVDGYDISDYTPLSLPSSGKRHFFGNLTDNANTDCATVSTCRGAPPLLRVVTNSSKRVWEWASKERPVLDNTHGGTGTDYQVRARVCTGGFTGGCKRYPNGNHKPIGLLHEYGESEQLYFGLLTGSYNKNLSGGVLRKNVGSFANEVDSHTGVFKNTATIVKTFDAIAVRDFNNGRTDSAYRSGWIANRLMSEGEFVDWGNPIAEMMYEVTRYFAGKKSPTAGFDTSGGHDAAIGLPREATWNDPYKDLPGAAYCSRAFNVVLSDPYPSFDTDQIPGSAFGGAGGDLAGFNASTEANLITAFEPGVAGQRFIGETTSITDGTPSPKPVVSLSNIRGLIPDEPSKQGGYYSAGIASWSHRNDNDLRNDLRGRQNIDTFVVALASPLPTITIPTASGNVIIMPFAKTIYWGSAVNRSKGSYQPTNQIVDFYVDTIYNVPGAPHDSSINGGRPYYKFRINFEDVEFGADHDMDAIAEYEIFAHAGGTVSVKVTPTYQAGSMKQNMGYVISGTNADGVYLVASDEDTSGMPYYLNVPPGRTAGYCDPVPTTGAPRYNECQQLPRLGGAAGFTSATHTFTVTAGGADILPSPLWYAAKWGAFVDSNGNNRPDLASEWDADGNGVPDAYFLVQNPAKLRDAMRNVLDRIVASSRSSSSGTFSSGFLDSKTLLYRTVTNPADWSGDLVAYRANNRSLAWRASAALPAHGSRNLWTRDGVTTYRFDYASLPSHVQTTVFGNSIDAVNYLRGDRSKELRNGGTYRNRPVDNVLGAFVHAEPVQSPDADVVCAGASDGFLHCFNDSNGRELFGYVPWGTLAKLPVLLQANYAHRYMVDGPLLITRKADTKTAAWIDGKNILVGTLGRGGRGWFALDVTDPTAFGSGSVLWDHTNVSDNDLGYVLHRPLILKKGGILYLVSGNGYASASGKNVLYVLRLDTGAVVTKLILGYGGGLGGLAALDVDGDGSEDVIYGTSLDGKVWKINVSANNPAAWSSFFGSAGAAVPFFVAKDGGGANQPIFAAPAVAKYRDPGNARDGQTLVVVGTGSYLTTADVTNTDTQTLYGLWDNGTSPITSRADLAAVGVRHVTIEGQPGRVFDAPSGTSYSGKRGWMLDLTGGERFIWKATFAYTGDLDTLFVNSLKPSSDLCQPGWAAYLNMLNPYDGGSLSKPVLDLDGDGSLTDGAIAGPGGGVVASVPLAEGEGGEVHISGLNSNVTTALQSGSSPPPAVRWGVGTLCPRLEGGQLASNRTLCAWRELTDF